MAKLVKTEKDIFELATSDYPKKCHVPVSKPRIPDTIDVYTRDTFDTQSGKRIYFVGATFVNTSKKHTTEQTAAKWLDMYVRLKGLNVIASSKAWLEGNSVVTNVAVTLQPENLQ